MFTGISCREEMLMIRKVHISLLAMPPGRTGPASRPRLLSSSSCPSASMAFKPAGVAAQPRPRKLAMKLVVMYSSAGCPEGRLGKRNRISGLRRLEAEAMTPPFAAICISPIHMETTPIIVIQRVTKGDSFFGRINGCVGNIRHVSGKSGVNDPYKDHACPEKI